MFVAVKQPVSAAGGMNDDKDVSPLASTFTKTQPPNDMINYSYLGGWSRLLLFASTVAA